MFKSISLLVAAIAAVDASEFPRIKSFSPDSDVRDHMDLSQDQTVLEELLHLRTAESFTAAEAVYRKGGHSKSIATVTLKTGLSGDIVKGTELYGIDKDERDVIGTAAMDYKKGDTVIEFVYPATKKDETPYDCHVGGLPEDKQERDGCLSPSGELAIKDMEAYEYEYVVHEDNSNGRTLAWLSTESDTRMRPDEDINKKYYTLFQPFVDYYGTYDYVDQIITAAFDAKDTKMSKGNFNLATEESDYEAREEIIKKGTAYLAVGMNVLRELQTAVEKCSLHSLDEAVAYYHGVDDNFYNDLANLRCSNFGTCHSDGDAKVNSKVFAYFNEMQNYIRNDKCKEAGLLVEEIARQMWIPMIQGTLRYAWILSDQNPSSFITSKGHQASGAIFAAGILPMLEKCNAVSSDIVYRNMKVRETGVIDDFPAIKTAFETCYKYLGITCDDVGGIMNEERTDYASPLTRPCIDSHSAKASSGSGKGKLVIGILFLILFVVAIGSVFMYQRASASSGKQPADDPKEAPPEQPLGPPKPTAEVV